jgi:carbon monoxide dehydrogenase subunit G
MRVGGEHRFPAPRHEVWRVLVRPDALAGTMPGIERLELHDERAWTAHVRLRLGLTALGLRLRFEKVEENEPERARLVARGRGPATAMSMDTSFELSELEGTTRMAWTADVSLSGPFGRVGEPLLRQLVRRQVAQMLDMVEARVVTEGA